MYRLPEYEYYKALSVEDAVKFLAERRDVKVLAGGTDLVLDMKTGRYRPKYVVDISGISSLKYIRDTGESLHVGALTTIQELLDSSIVAEKTPLLRLVAREFAYWQIRNMATIGGNLCNASPAADTAPSLLVYEAVVKAVSIRGERFIPITDFFLGPRQIALAPDELLVEVIVPYRKLGKAGFAYTKIGRRRGHDMSVVAVAVALKLEDGVISDVRIALNSVAPKPVRAYTVERALVGKKPTLEVFEEASKLVVKDISPITDVRAPAEYRLYLSKLLVRELLLEATKGAYRGGFE
ncbi:MAG: xanthine dehydrogenase family protein subunit M [Desulfurococcaceae archaeon]